MESGKDQGTRTGQTAEEFVGKAQAAGRDFAVELNLDTGLCIGYPLSGGAAAESSYMDTLQKELEMRVFLEDQAYMLRMVGLDALREAWDGQERQRVFGYRALAGDGVPYRRTRIVCFLRSVPGRWAYQIDRAARDAGKNALYDLALRHIYDELYEINLTAGTYRIVSHQPDKYETLAESGALSPETGKNASRIIHPDDVPRFRRFFSLDTLRGRLAKLGSINGEFRKRTPAGEYKWAGMTVVPVHVPEGEELYLCFVTDIDEKKQAQEFLHENQLLLQRQMDDERYRIIVERTHTVVIEWNVETGSFYFSPEAKEFRFVRQLDGDLSKCSLSDETIHPEDRENFKSGLRALCQGGEGSEMTVRLEKTGGSYLWCKLTITVLRNAAGAVSRVIVTINDQDQLMKAQRALAYRVDYDPLTGYSNFDKFKRDVAELLKRRGDQKYSLWYSDIKNFKYINDIYGYDVGDHLLQYWAKVLAWDLKEDETFSRISADNFTSFRRYESREDLMQRFSRAAKLLSGFEELKSKKFPVELVSGIYCIECGEDVLSIEDMIDRSNMAQKSVKYLGGSRISFYTEEMRSQVIREKSMEADMVQALDKGQFQLYLQAQVDIQGGCRVAGAEVLVRWMRPGHGLVPPGEFIPLFEKNGFIVELDEYIFRESCRMLAQRLKTERIDAAISVNVSRLSLFQPNFVQRYLDIKREFAIPDGLLELECTETVMVENVHEIARIGEQLRQNGFLLGMDDFGSGYSSLNVLKDLTVDILKLDMDFFRNGLTSQRDRAIVISIVGMADTLDMRIVAEGVEDMEQVRFLRDIGCDLVQGYVFAKPVPFEDFDFGQSFESPVENQ